MLYITSGYSFYSLEKEGTSVTQQEKKRRPMNKKNFHYNKFNL